MSTVRCRIEYGDLEGDHGMTAGVMAVCGECGHETESFGTSEASIKRCLVLLREECPMRAHNFYVDENEL